MSELLSNFMKPPKGYGEVSFFWWLGDKLTKERLTWQLDKLKGKHIEGLQVNYAHSDKGGHAWGFTYESDPMIFSEDWWELYNWFLKEAKKRGMAVSLSDYTLCTPGQGFYTDEVIRKNPQVQGSTLKHEEQFLNAGESLCIEEKENTLYIAAYKYENGAIVEDTFIDLLELKNAGEVYFKATEGKWLVILVYFEQRIPSIDFMNPLAGREIVKEFFHKFEDRNPDESGKGLNYFFSDELNFNISGNMWNSIFAEEFKKRKGYDIIPYLGAIFIDIGNITQKIRLDYKDVLVQLEEENYFKPVYDWHEERGMIYGCDHGGRGTDVTEFGDYFRTQKWNQGPGNDQPALRSNIITNKVSSSIAHMYKRPRVWLEGFYGSGWSTSSGAVTDATFRNFAMGHNLLTLHGLYYSTHGGWWEWAPPCNHFRMPYWEHMGEFLRCTNRLSYLLAQGVHVCDVAILYPVAAVEGGIDGEMSVNIAFEAGKYFYDQGLDFDFIDFESVERATIEDKELKVSGEGFKVIILPAMKTVRFNMLKKLLEFHRAGGMVICIGSLPETSDHAGRNDVELTRINQELFVGKKNHVETVEKAYDIVHASIRMDFEYKKIDKNATYFLHRRVGTKDIYMVYGMPKGEVCNFRAKGSVELWNPWNAEVLSLKPLNQNEQGTVLKMPLEKDELQIIVFDEANASNSKAYVETEIVEQISLDGKWNFELKPTMDNRFGDFRLPAFEGFIGAEIRRLEYFVDEGDFYEEDCNEVAWNEVSCGYGPRFLKLGPLQDSEELEALEKQILAKNSISVKSEFGYENRKLSFKKYEYSDRMCIEGDPGHQGYHGLKGEMSDEFLFTGKHEFTSTSTKYLPEEGGDIYYFWTTVYSEHEEKVDVKMSAFMPIRVWINGVVTEGGEILLKQGTNIILLKYKGAGRGYFILESKNTPKEWIQTYPLSMIWYKKPGVFEFDILPDKKNVAGKYRFTSAPGLKELLIEAYGEIEALVGGKAAKLISSEKLENGVTEFKFQIEDVNKECSHIELSILHEKGKYGGTALPEPIKMFCIEGLIELGDWSKIQGLYSYSGGAYCRNAFCITKEQLKNKIVLDLGEIISSVELRVNRKLVGIKVAPSWKFDISAYVVEGENHVEALIFNTLGNHYTSIPTRYRGNINSGLIGPVSVSLEK